MIGTLISILINTGAFYGISKILPGFHVKDERTALLIALAFSILGFFAGILIAPVMGIVVMILLVFAFIPVIGPLIAKAGFIITTFSVFFLLSVILLIAIDKMMEDFKMDSPTTAVIASVILASLNVGIRLLLPGV